MSSTYCFLIQFILNFVGSTAADTVENNLFHGKRSDIPAPYLPTECMLEIFKHVQAQDSGLYSCLLVNRYWCKNIVPLLWSRPFEALSTENRYKLIHTYLACLDREDYLNLSSSLQSYNIKIIEIRQPLFNYSMYLEEFSYKQLEIAVHSTIHIWCNKTFINNHKQDQILLIATTLCKLFMRRSISLKSFIIDKYFSHSDIPQISTFIEQPGLSHLTRFKIDYCKPMTTNTIKLLENLPYLCSNIRCLDIKFPIFEHNHKAISRIISTQKCLNEFNLSGVRIGSERILFSLQSRHETLNIIRLENVYITEACFNALALCKNLKDLSLWYCRGLNIENTSVLLKSKFSLKKLRLGFSPICSDVAGLILQVGGISLKELEIDLINSIIVETILDCCPNVKEIKLANYFPHDNNYLFYQLFFGLSLENLEIFINSKNLDYEDMKLTGQDLPPSLKYLKLSCGFTIDQFKELFKTCNAPLETIIIDYVDLNYDHIKVITKFIREKKTVKTLGIVGMDDMTSQGIKELKMLKKRYGIFIIPSYELNQW
ncbi:hypothetical protein RhiirA4_456705 [Rhizophagus irregularis]|uniref:F-box domain-containing protein n=1 Tax=Rhizophagus irregularis TaxID=588596 RepID=A0A2I1G859_9GLOM|nr:hypothetical protein RhiirA4_456705 [Rhizophagus irregularis]